MDPILDFFSSWMVGFLGSLHCLGMCGPLILAYSLHSRGCEGFVSQSDGRLVQGEMFHHVAFHAGRVLTYGLLGALGGLCFGLTGADQVFRQLRPIMTLLGGTVMILLGLVLLRALPLPQLILSPLGDAGREKRWQRLLESRSTGAKVALGMAVGFLPCGLSWAMIVKAATTHNAIAGLVVMLAFGLGTVPALLLPGLSASLLSVKLRLAGERLAALSVIIMGLVLVYKGARILV